MYSGVIKFSLYVFNLVQLIYTVSSVQDIIRRQRLPKGITILDRKILEKAIRSETILSGKTQNSSINIGTQLSLLQYNVTPNVIDTTQKVINVTTTINSNGSENIKLISKYTKTSVKLLDVSNISGIEKATSFSMFFMFFSYEGAGCISKLKKCYFLSHVQNQL